MKTPTGATHVSTVNGKYFKVESGVIVKTYGVKNIDINNGTLIEDCSWIVKVETKREKSIQEMIGEAKDAQLGSVCDEYMKGLYNGLELAHSISEGRAPKYLE